MAINTYLPTIESKQTKQRRTATESWIWRMFMIATWERGI